MKFHYKHFLPVAAIIILTFILSAKVELFERFSTFSRCHEYMQLDELIFIFISLGIYAFIIISRQRKLLKLQNIEKALMLKENQHRQKNNLNMILSLLKLDKPLFNTLEAKEAYDKAISRIESLNVLYENLNNSNDNFKVSVKSYFETYFNRLDELLNHNKINVTIRVDDIYVKQEIITPLSLIINELYTNSVKHAFNGQADCKIDFSFKQTADSIIVVFSDNGKGFSPDTKPGFGHTMFKALAKQLNANTQIKHDKGTSFIIEIPIS